MWLYNSYRLGFLHYLKILGLHGEYHRWEVRNQYIIDTDWYASDFDFPADFWLLKFLLCKTNSWMQDVVDEISVCRANRFKTFTTSSQDFNSNKSVNSIICNMSPFFKLCKFLLHFLNQSFFSPYDPRNKIGLAVGSIFLNGFYGGHLGFQNGHHENHNLKKGDITAYRSRCKIRNADFQYKIWNANVKCGCQMLMLM